MATGNSFNGQKSVRGSEEDFHIVCLPCHRDGETMAAFGYCCQCKEHLCASCFKYHKRSTPTRHHKLLNKDEMPDTQDLDATVQPSPSDNLTSPCPDHKNEMLKFYCHDHKLLLCGICVALKHTKQCQVAYIPDMSEQIINSKEYKNVAERMDEMLTECASIKEKTSEDAEHSNSSLNEGLEHMRMLRQKMNDKFDKMEEDIENKIQSLKQQNDDRNEEDDNICNDVIRRVTVVTENLNQLNASKQQDLLFVELKQALNQLQEFEENISLLSTKSPIRLYKFVPSSMISVLLQSEETWGDLTAIQQQHASTSDQHSGQARDQTKPTNCQYQTASTLTQQQQRASTADLQSGQTRDQTKPNNCQDQVVNTSSQQQKQRTSTSDQQQSQVMNEANSKGNRPQATSLSDQQQQGKTEAQPKPTSQQAQPTNYQAQTANSTSQQQDQTREKIKPKSNGPYAASSSDQQQCQPTPTSQQAKQIHAYIQATRQSKINVKTSDDMGNCCITGMTTFTSGKLVLADNKNCAIKLFDIKTDKIISGLPLGLSEPWDITATSCTQVAVTVPNKQEIQFITATDNLSLSHKVKTNGKCYGICYYEDTLVVTYKNLGKLEIMNMQGKVVTIVQKYLNGEDIFKRPEYVQANSKYIYVSDYGKKQVIMLNLKGEVNGRIGGLGGPEGLTLLHDGSLLVCEWAGGTVYHVSCDGTTKRAVLADVSYPQAICVDDGGHKLYISRWNVLYNTEDNNNIIVYKL